MKAYARMLAFGPRKTFYYLLYYTIAVRLPMPGMPGALVGHWLRRRCAQALFKSCGVGVRIAPGVRFGTGKGIIIGNNSNIGYQSWLYGDISIGDYVMMAPRITILTENHETSDSDTPMALQGQHPSKPVIIGNDIWIGTKSIILPGVKIGDHSIIGAGSVVTKDIPPWSIAAGNPARVVKSRKASSES